MFFNTRNQLFAKIFVPVLFMLGLPLSANEDIAYLASNHWIVASEKEGLSIYDGELKQITALAGQFESVDGRIVASGEKIIAAINKENNALELFTLGEGELSLVNRSEENEFALEAVCLSFDPQSKLLYAFVVSAGKNVEQRVVFDNNSKQFTNLKVRELPISHAISSCRSEDESKAVYFNEEMVGVWAFNTDPESETDRRPVVMQQPFGQLKSENKLVRSVSSDYVAINQTDRGGLVLASVSKFQQNEFIHLADDFDEAFEIRKLSSTNLEIVYSSKNGKLHKRIVKRRETPAKRTSSSEFGVNIFPIQASVETHPVSRFGDAADDPAIWVNSEEPSQSLILGTDKKSGLGVYSLKGELKQFISTGRINNVDLRPNFLLNGDKVSIVAASNRDNNSITLYQINASGKVDQLNDIATNLDEVYGLCMYYQAAQNGFYVIINDKDGRFEQYRLIEDNGTITGKLFSQFKVIDQPEGCVANDRNGDLFVGVEDHGVWLTNADSKGSKELEKILAVGKELVDDVEGLGLYLKDKAAYLVASSQGNDSYAVFNASRPFNFLGSFRITANLKQSVDGASETDGLEVSSANFGGEFSEGMIVVQDGRNVMPQEPQNFKLIPFSPVKALILENKQNTNLTK